MRKWLIKLMCVILILLCFLLTSCDDVLSEEIIECIETEIAEEHGLPVECVMVVENKKIECDNGTFYLVELIIQDEDYAKTTYAVKLDVTKKSNGSEGITIIEWRIREGE